MRFFIIPLLFVVISSPLLFSDDPPPSPAPRTYFESYLMEHAISPDGKRLAYGTRVDGELFLNLLDLETLEKHQIKVGEDAPYPNDVYREIRPASMPYVEWASNAFVLYKPDNYRLFSVDAQLSKLNELARYTAESNRDARRHVEIERNVKAIIPSIPDRVLIESFVQEHSAATQRTQVGMVGRSGVVIIPGGQKHDQQQARFDYIWVDVESGKLTNTNETAFTRKSGFDSDGNLRAEFRELSEKTTSLFLIENESENAKELHEILAQKGVQLSGFRFDKINGTPLPESTLLGFGHNPDWLFFATSKNDETRGVYGLNTNTFEAPELLFRDETFDVGIPGALFDETSLLHSEAQRSPAGIRYQGIKEITAWFIPELQAAQKAVDELLPESENQIQSWDEALETFSVTSRGGKFREALYVYQRQVNRLQQIENEGPDNATTVPLWLTGKAGDPLLFYLSVPNKAVPGKPSPTVVLFPDDPLGRHEFTLPDEARLLIDAGFNVLRVNSRGLAGFGKSHLESGYKQLADVTADDVSTALDWCFARGLSQPGEVDAIGFGFGGWLALNTVKREASVFRKVVAIAPITELEYFIKQRKLDWDLYSDSFSLRYLDSMFGDLKRDKKQIVSSSPIRFAKELTLPVLLVHGFDDDVIPFRHSENLFKKLPKGSSENQLITIKKAGHGDWTPDQIDEIYAAILSFLQD